MSEYLTLILIFFTGGMLAVCFFGGLWWTVRIGVTSNWPGVLFLTSLLLRTGVVLAGFIFVSQGHWIKLVVCFAGFLIARLMIVTQMARAISEDRTPLKTETCGASKS